MKTEVPYKLFQAVELDGETWIFQFPIILTDGSRKLAFTRKAPKYSGRLLDWKYIDL